MTKIKILKQLTKGHIYRWGATASGDIPTITKVLVEIDNKKHISYFVHYLNCGAAFLAKPIHLEEIQIDCSYVRDCTFQERKTIRDAIRVNRLRLWSDTYYWYE